jgi:putrescine aminotransferase
MRFRPVLGRTGRLFALEHENVEPDIVLLSKSLGAGVLPVSVCCAREDIWRRAFDTHDRFDTVISTFGGNAAACAAALKTIELTLAQDLPGRAAALGRHARQRLEALARRHDMVKSVRGQGLLLGIELEPPEFSKAAIGGNLASMVASCLLNDHGVVTLYFDLAPNVLRFEPPLIVTEAQIDEAIDALDRVLALGIGGLALSIGKSAIARLVHRG